MAVLRPHDTLVVEVVAHHVSGLNYLWPLPGRWHVLTADRAEHFAADLDHPYRLIVRPTAPVPRLPDDGIDWTRARAVTVVEVFDYH